MCGCGIYWFRLCSDRNRIGSPFFRRIVVIADLCLSRRLFRVGISLLFAVAILFHVLQEVVNVDIPLIVVGFVVVNGENSFKTDLLLRLTELLNDKVVGRVEHGRFSLLVHLEIGKRLRGHGL